MLNSSAGYFPFCLLLKVAILSSQALKLLFQSIWSSHQWRDFPGCGNFSSFIAFSYRHSCCCCGSVAKLCLTLCDLITYSMLHFSVHHCLPEFSQTMSIESVTVMPSNHLILCCPLLLLPSVFPSIRVFSNESALRIRWPKYWSSNFSISPSNEYSSVISFRTDVFDLLAVQGTLESLSSTTVWKCQFLSIQPSLRSNSLIHT